MTTTRIITENPAITAARDALAAGRAHRAELAAKVDELGGLRDARPTGKGSRTIARAYSAALTALDDYATGELDYLRREVEMQVRIANPGAEQREIMLAVRGM
jgi:hypothetical protein